MAANLSCLTGSSICFRWVLNSFVQPSHSGAPSLLLTRVLPYKTCYNGFALLCHCLESTPVIQHQSNLGGRFLLQCAVLFSGCFLSYDIPSEPFLIKVTACFQYYKEYPYCFACNCYLRLHPSKRIPFPVPVIEEHILKYRIPIDQCTRRFVHCSP